MVKKMKIVNNVMKRNLDVPLEYMPDKYIVKMVLQKKLKCDMITSSKTDNVLFVNWVKE